MTPSEIILASRQLYNAVGDTNWSDSEMCTLIRRGEMKICTEVGMVIETPFTTNTVIGTQEYVFPSNAIDIKRITFNGKKLFPITMRDDDSLTIQNQATTDSGEPIYYYTFNRTIYLRPIPNTVGTLKIFAHCSPDTVTITSVLEIPLFTHDPLVNFVVSEMAAKDQNFKMAQYYRDIFRNEDIPEIKKRARLMKRADGFAVVQSEELLPHAYLGAQ